MGWNDPNLFGIAFPPRSEFFQEIGHLLGEVSTFVRVLDDVEKLPGPQAVGRGATWTALKCPFRIHLTIFQADRYLFNLNSNVEMKLLSKCAFPRCHRIC